MPQIRIFRWIKIAQSLIENNFSVLRFDFSGCGESEGGKITVENEVDDLKSAINFIQEKGFSRIGLIGESLGGLVSLLAYNSKNIGTLVKEISVTT